MPELRQKILRARVIADARRRAAAEVDRRGGERQLIGLAGDVAVGPVDAGTAAQIAGVRSADARGMLQTLAHLKRDGHAP